MDEYEEYSQQCKSWGLKPDSREKYFSDLQELREELKVPPKEGN